MTDLDAPESSYEPSSMKELHPRKNPWGNTARHYRCKACTAEFKNLRLFRHCGFDTGDRSMRHINAGCATLSRLRWILRANGVHVVHPEASGNVQTYSLGLPWEPEGARLVGIWLAGHMRTLAMLIVQGHEVRPIKIGEAESILADYQIEADGEAAEKSVHWTR